MAPLSFRPLRTWSTISSIIAMTSFWFWIQDISPSKEMNSVTWRLVLDCSALKAGPISYTLSSPVDIRICLYSWGDWAR